MFTEGFGFKPVQAFRARLQKVDDSVELCDTLGFELISCNALALFPQGFVVSEGAGHLSTPKRGGNWRLEPAWIRVVLHLLAPVSGGFSSDQRAASDSH